MNKEMRKTTKILALSCNSSSEADSCSAVQEVRPIFHLELRRFNSKCSLIHTAVILIRI
jgi:hypothetical protein